MCMTGIVARSGAGLISRMPRTGAHVAVSSTGIATKASARGPKSVDLHVGLQIRNRRKELGISQDNLGKEIGVSFQQIQKYENGSNRVGASRLAAIAKALRVQIGNFFPDDDAEVPITDVAAHIADRTCEYRDLFERSSRITGRWMEAVPHHATFRRST
jgi:transcriptional regulator with XRE-family HTH domain